MLEVAIILGSTRPGRNGAAVARWVEQVAAARHDARYTLLDLADFSLPLLDEPVPPSQGQYQQPHTRAWADCIARFDAFVMVTPEYNHGTSAALKNALDFLYKEWLDKVAGFVSYGSVGGARAVEHLRLICAELQMATVRNQVLLSLRDDFEDYREFKPGPHQDKALHALLDRLLRWGQALRGLRPPITADRPAP